MTRAGRSSHGRGSVPLARPVRKSPVPNIVAARAARPAARSERARPIGTPSSISLPPPAAAMATPTARTPRMGPVPGAIRSPATTANTAAMAPSVEQMVETTPTAPTR